MHVTAIHLHPVKSCHRVEVDRAVVGPYGLDSNRAWQVVGADGYVTQRTHPQMTRIRPQLIDGGLVLRADGMSDLEVARPPAADAAVPTATGDVNAGDGGDDAAAWLSDVLGAAVRLVGIADGYERRLPGIFATQSAFSDAAPILVANDASHRFLVDRASEPFGIERFRANVVVDAGEPWVEDTWRTVRVGAATVQCVIPWPRCAVPQIDQDTGRRTREPALVLRTHRWCAALPDAPELVQSVLCGNALFGMAASIEPVGTEIAVGDRVEVLSTDAALLPT